MNYKPIKKLRTLKMLKDIKLNAINILGWRNDRKIVVIESDDWGSIRMPSRAVYNKLLDSGDRVDSDPYSRYDSLASEDDLSLLFEVLSSFKDANGNHPVITANCVMANPNFEKIKASGYQHYHYELFTETLKRYPNHNKSFGLWQEGIKNKLFYPQLHGREHLNVIRWMNNLQNGKKDILRAFEQEMIITNDSYTLNDRYSYMGSFNNDGPESIERHNIIINESAALFRRIFGFESQSFIAPCYIWSRTLESILLKNGVNYIQGGYIQYVPKIAKETTCFDKIYHYTGQKNKIGQIYLVRNCSFEPSYDEAFDSLSQCLHQIDVAFRLKKPAIISSHRLNYIGFIDESNRDRNLKLLSALLQEINRRWPDVEYMTSNELGNFINE